MSYHEGKYELQPYQRRFLGSPRSPVLMNDRTGRWQAAVAIIQAEALDDEQAELAINDLGTEGYALMRNGTRYDPPKPSPAKITFDEIKND